MQQEDIQQISNLLDKKFEENNKVLSENLETKLSEKIDKKFQENNKIIKEEIVGEVGVIFSQSFNELEAKIDSIDEKLNEVVDKDDKIIKKQQDFETELASNLGAHDRMTNQIGNHEIRLKKLELPA